MASMKLFQKKIASTRSQPALSAIDILRKIPTKVLLILYQQHAVLQESNHCYCHTAKTQKLNQRPFMKVVSLCCHVCDASGQLLYHSKSTCPISLHGKGQIYF